MYMYNIIFYVVTVQLVMLSFPLFVCVCSRDSRPTPPLIESPLLTLFINGPTTKVLQWLTSAVVNCPSNENN